MSLCLQEKKEIVIKVNKIAKKALSAVIADPRGITANKMTELRKACRESSVYMSIIRNNLLHRAVEGTSFECLKNSFIGPVCIAFSIKHPGTAARLFKEFSQVNLEFKIKVAAFSGKLIQETGIDRLASLPTYEEAVLRLIILMKEASIGRLVRILVNIKNKKEKVP